MSEAQDDSEILLTQTTLSGIYGNDINKDNDEAMYNALSENIAKKKLIKENQPVHIAKTPLSTKIFKFIFATIVLGISGILYNQLGQHIHDNHILIPELASKPLDIGIKISNKLVFQGWAPKWLIYAIEGILFGSVQPIFDKFIFNSYDEKAKNLKNLDNLSIIRTAVAFLGVIFAVRKVEWNSSLQASIAWSFLSPCVWLLLDGSLSGFVSSVSVASIASISVVLFEGLPSNWYNDYDFTAVMLWLGNFFFFGLIIFGKIGRYSFS